MARNLKAELVRKDLEPVKAVSNILNCSDKTARNKLSGLTQFTIDEANKIVIGLFSEDRFSIEYLFIDKTPINLRV